MIFQVNDIVNNRYKLLEQIGKGGMAFVYKTEDLTTNNIFAIKILIEENKVSNAVERFKREAKALETINSDNVVKIYDVELNFNLEKKIPRYIVMELVEGQTLKQILNKKRTLSVDEAINYILQLLSGLEAIHNLGFIHRDIKPQNILIAKDGTLKITDFGIALLGNDQQLTQTGKIVGSVYYIAPELLRNQRASVLSDIYAVGIIFYEILAGVQPFIGNDIQTVLSAHINDEPKDISKVNPQVEQQLANIIKKAMARNPKERYKSVRDMTKELEYYYNNRIDKKYSKTSSNISYSEKKQKPQKIKRSDKLSGQTTLEDFNKLNKEKEDKNNYQKKSSKDDFQTTVLLDRYGKKNYDHFHYDYNDKDKVNLKLETVESNELESNVSSKNKPSSQISNERRNLIQGKLKAASEKSNLSKKIYSNLYQNSNNDMYDFSTNNLSIDEIDRYAKNALKSEYKTETILIPDQDEVRNQIQKINEKLVDEEKGQFIDYSQKENQALKYHLSITKDELHKYNVKSFQLIFMICFFMLIIFGSLIGAFIVVFL